MGIDYQKLRLDGIYKQNEQGQLMLRAKIPAGVFSSEQANKLAELAETFAGSRVHLTTRGSIEFHDLDYNDLPEVTRGLAAVGLTSRGACGGAVRGISCSSTLGENFSPVQALVRKLHRHFVGNPYFEGLPKKFKIGVDGDYSYSRHLIQDIGLVYVDSDNNADTYDVWMAGGLGREPQAAFLFASGVPAEKLIPLIESAIRIFKKHGEQNKRLKHLLNRIGEVELRKLLQEENREPLLMEIDNGLGQSLSVPDRANSEQPITVPVFAGELSSRDLQSLGEFASRFAKGVLALTADQDIAFFPTDKPAAEQLKLELSAAGLINDIPENAVTFRICPGSHECRMGLSPTRDVAKSIIATLPNNKQGATWAISGCPNSCSQPQLADYGIIARKLIKDHEGSRSPRYDLVRRTGKGLGEIKASGLNQEELKTAIADID
jgi:sulfite reductase beta subunit-like hemoprotein